MQDTTSFAWAIVGPGAIAHRFAEAVHGLPNTHVHAVVGRDAQRAQAFAARWSDNGNAPQVLTDLGLLLSDPNVDGVYVATPHAQHGDIVRACLLAGKAVLCEKPLVPHLAAGQQLVELAQQRSVFLMEALWTRFLPIYDLVGGWLQQQAIGPVRALQSSFCFNAPYDPHSRMFDPALAGGALLDVGIYNLAVTRWVLEMALSQCPPADSLHAHGVLAPTGVDQRVHATLVFPGTVASQFVCGFDTSSDNALRILGERGCITLPRDFWQAEYAVLEVAGQPAQTVQAPFRINGFEGEIEEAMRCARAGLVQSPRMPHAETLALLGWMDELRRQMGVRYPFE